MLLRLAALLSGLYTCAAILKLTKPANGGLSASLFDATARFVDRIPFWGTVAGWPIAAAIGATMVTRHRRIPPARREHYALRYELAIAGAMIETCGSAGEGRTFPVIE